MVSLVNKEREDYPDQKELVEIEVLLDLRDKEDQLGR